MASKGELGRVQGWKSHTIGLKAKTGSFCQHRIHFINSFFYTIYFHQCTTLDPMALKGKKDLIKVSVYLIPKRLHYGSSPSYRKFIFLWPLKLQIYKWRGVWLTLAKKEIDSLVWERGDSTRVNDRAGSNCKRPTGRAVRPRGCFLLSHWLMSAFVPRCCRGRIPLHFTDRTKCIYYI